MILAAATVDKPINVDVNVIIHLVDFGNFSTSSSISHLVFNRGETQDDWLLVGYNMGAVGARGRQSSKAFPLGSMATGKRHCRYSEMIIIP